ncbi:MAG: class I SAM-dependent methyltransferase [Bacteroidota bacterium]
MTKFFLNLLPGFLNRRIKAYLVERYKRSLSGKPVEEIFNDIYEQGVWGSVKNRSEGGSTIDQTMALKSTLPELFRKYNISSLLDAPCGDFTWMQHVDLAGVNYIGGDIVGTLINNNQIKYATPRRQFIQLNLIEDQLPKSNLLFCRDCFVHFSNDHIRQSLDNIKAAKIKYLLVTTFTDTRVNKDILTGEWRRVNLEKPPFNLTPIDIINEKCPEGEGKFSDKSLMLVKL